MSTTDELALVRKLKNNISLKDQYIKELESLIHLRDIENKQLISKFQRTRQTLYMADRAIIRLRAHVGNKVSSQTDQEIIKYMTARKTCLITQPLEKIE